MEQSPKSPDVVLVTVEAGKATMDVTPLVVKDWQDLPDRPQLASYRCPGCHRRATGSKTETHRHTCGAWVTIGTKEAG